MIKPFHQPDRKVVVYTAKCRDTCEQRTEEIAAAFDAAILARAGPDPKELLIDFFCSCGYCALEIHEPQIISIIPAPSNHGSFLQRNSFLCPLHMPGAPPLFCTLRDCREYEHGCYAIRNFDLR